MINKVVWIVLEISIACIQCYMYACSLEPNQCAHNAMIVYQLYCVNHVFPVLILHHIIHKNIDYFISRDFEAIQII